MCFRRRRNKSNSSTGSSESTTRSPSTYNSDLPTYELAAVVSDTISLDQNGRLVSVKRPNFDPYEDTDIPDLASSGYSTIRSVLASQPQSPYAQVDKKRDSRTVEDEAGKTSPGDGDKCGVTVDGVVVGNNHPYENVVLPTVAASESGQTRESVCTSINDFTLIDNDLYNSLK